jgi:hypothetical protein
LSNDAKETLKNTNMRKITEQETIKALFESSGFIVSIRTMCDDFKSWEVMDLTGPNGSKFGILFQYGQMTDCPK